MAAAHLLLYAQQHLCLERRARHAASRPTHGVRAGAAARAWWGYAAKAAAAEWGGRRMPLGAELLRVRREYLEAYRESLLADTGGPNLSAQVEPRPPSTYPLSHAPSTYPLPHAHTAAPRPSFTPSPSPPPRPSRPPVAPATATLWGGFAPTLSGSCAPVAVCGAIAGCRATLPLSRADLRLPRPRRRAVAWGAARAEGGAGAQAKRTRAATQGARGPLPTMTHLTMGLVTVAVSTVAIFARSARGGRRSVRGERPGGRRSGPSGTGCVRRGARWKGRRGC